MFRYWRKRKMWLRLNPEMRSVTRRIALIQIVYIVVGLGAGVGSALKFIDRYTVWLPLGLALIGVLGLEALLIRLLKQQNELREERELHRQFRADTEAMFTKLREQRHDFLAHVGAIQHMLGSDQSKEAYTYLEQLVDEYEHVNLSLKGEKAHLAAILLQVRQQAAQNDVKLTLDLTAPLSALPMEPLDQTKLIANALKNALEAAEEVEGELRYVTIRSFIGGGLYVLEIENSTNPLPSTLIERLFKGYGISTKAGDRRGIGTFIIANLIERYNGSLEFSAINNRFWLKIKLPIVK